MDIYTVKDTDIVYETSVDFGTRQCSKEIHIVQYDSSQPIIAVELYKNSKKFTLPSGYEANVRLGKRDGTFVYKKALGTNSDGDVLYWAVDVQMTLLYGKVQPIIELLYNGAVVGSSAMPLVIDRNPVQSSDVESQAEYPAIMERLETAESNVVHLAGSKLDKHTEVTDIHQAYVKASSGDNWMWDMSEYNKANTIAFRTSDGQLKVNETPAEDDDATSKKYVDDKADSKLDKHTEVTDIHQAYVKASSGDNWMWDMSEYNKANTIAFRTSDGQLKVNETPAEDDDATSKKYVDDKADSKLNKNTTSQYIVYGTTTAGTQASITYTSTATENTILIRNSSGQAQIKSYKAGPTAYTDTTTDAYIANLGQLTKMHQYNYGDQCWSNTLIIGDIASPQAITLLFFINANGDQCPIWMFQLNNSTDTSTYNWSDLDQTTLLPYSNTIYWLGGIEPVFEYGKRYTLMFWPADSTKIGQFAGSEYTGALIGTWSAA